MRAALISATLIGVIVSRHLLKLDDLRDAPPEQIIELLRPCLRSLTHRRLIKLPASRGRHRTAVEGHRVCLRGADVRVRAVDGDQANWREDDRGYCDVPVSSPLSDLQIAEQLPTLGLRLGDPRPHQRGKIREYLVL